MPLNTQDAARIPTLMAEAPVQRRSEGLRKAAIILAMLDTDAAVKVCSELDAETVRRLAAEVAQLTTVAQEERDKVLEDFVKTLESQEIVDGRARARDLLRNVFGHEAEPQVLQEAGTVETLNALRSTEPAALHRYLQNELPQTVAVILSYLSPDQVAGFLSLLDAELRAEVVYRMASMTVLAPGAFEALTEGVAQLTRSLVLSDSGFEAVSPEFIANVVSNLPADAVKQIMERLKEKAPETAAQVDELIFTFDDVLKLDDRSLQLVLRAVDERTIAMALRKLPDEGRERILANVSSRARELIQEEEELLGRVRVRDVEDARRKIAGIARDLAEKGEISISRESEEEYV